MGLRIRKRIRIAKGVYINVGKKGISTSVKVGNTTFNSRGRVTTSLPGTGISYTQNSKRKTEITSKKRVTSKPIIRTTHYNSNPNHTNSFINAAASDSINAINEAPVSLSKKHIVPAKKPSWLSVILWLLFFSPVGIYKLIKRMT